MRIRIGNQTAYSASPVTRPFQFAVENGFDCFEWFPDKGTEGGWDTGDMGAALRGEIRTTALAHGISLSVHAPWPVNILRPEDREGFESAAAFARDIGATLLIIHLFKEEGIEAYARALAGLLNDLEGSGLRLAIENTPDITPGDFNGLFGLLGEMRPVRPGNVGICLDLGHANLCPETRNDYIGYVDLLDPAVPIFHLHLHENYGDRDSHLPLFTGPAGTDDSGIRGLVERLARRDFSGCAILEQWPEPPALLADARRRFLLIVDSLGKTGAGKPRPQEAAPADEFAARIADANRKHLSWRKRLNWIHGLLTDPSLPLDAEELTYIAIYLRFIGTGEVPCAEDGGHYRPSHHARLSGDIYRRLQELSTPENALIIRRILPWLPSFDTSFTRPEPLTRIRDIAHRNDIPRELKQEIKTTLQNKLHRSAGPEDLATSEALLKRITGPDANYPADFINEFRRFHGELEEFFNTRSLDDQLRSIAQWSEGLIRAQMEKLLSLKGRYSEPGSALATLEALTELRSCMAGRMTGEVTAGQQQLLIADIRLEEFAFVLLSLLINHLAPSGESLRWHVALRCLGLAVSNLRLSGFEPDECGAVESEIAAWSEGFDSGSREKLLRLKATVDRCWRLAEAYSESVLSLLPEKVRILGQALGASEHAIRLFTESDIREHLVFQLSKLSTIILKSIREGASLPPWYSIVHGGASGLLRVGNRMEEVLADGGPVIALLTRLEGDEELPPWLRGIVVSHEVPHLSHFSVRARQEHIPFAICEDRGKLDEIGKLEGKRIKMEVSSENFELTAATEGDDFERKRAQVHIRVPEANLDIAETVMPLERVSAEIGGNKANEARRLEELSRDGEAGFLTPRSVTVTFAAMQRALNESPGLQREYNELMRLLDESDDDELFTAQAGLAGIAGSLPVPGEIERRIVEHFGADARLMVRSSSNCEDLEGFSGAGLHESVANVQPQDILKAVQAVWSSLWTRRAVIARKNSGISQEAAHMAVLIQEMIGPDYAFFLHTVNPLTCKRDEVLNELAAGLGEVLASGRYQGSPYKLTCDKSNGKVRIQAFASYSKALYPAPEGGILEKTVDYSKSRLSTDDAFRNSLVARLASVGKLMEDSLGSPRDIEGAVLGNDVYLFQCRPQLVNCLHGEAG